MGSRLHGMARRAEQIELNRGSCTEVCRHDVLGRLRMRGGTTELTLAGGTEGSNPAPSSGESVSAVNPGAVGEKPRSLAAVCGGWGRERGTCRLRTGALDLFL